jgi:hypothetical protein
MIFAIAYIGPIQFCLGIASHHGQSNRVLYNNIRIIYNIKIINVISNIRTKTFVDCADDLEVSRS